MNDFQAGNGDPMHYEGLPPQRQSHLQQHHHHSPPPTSYQGQSNHYDSGMYQQQQQQHQSYQSSDPWQQSGGFIQSYGGPSRSPRSTSQDLQLGYPPVSVQFEQRTPSDGSGRPTPPTPVGWGPPPAQQQYAQGRPDSAGVHVKVEDTSQDRVVGGAGSKRKHVGGNDGASAGPSKAGQSGPIEAPTSAAPSEFIKKLYKMLEDESSTYGKGFAPGQPRGAAAARGSVGWARGGISFVVWDMNTFTTKILPQTFRHSNFSSFVRQLNKYGFSKIKHMNEDTGVIKENVWEFQHAHFQAGGKADLEFIKRKIVPSKKAEAGADATSPVAALPVEATSEDLSRLAAMENRIRGLEEHLSRALEEVRQVKLRETGTATLLREMLSHMMASERNASVTSTSSEVYPSPHVQYMLQLLQQVAPGLPHNTYGYTNPTHHPLDHGRESASTQSHVSSQTDGSRRSQDGVQADPLNVNRMNGTHHPDEPQVGFGTEQIAGVPVYADTPAWLTEGVTVPMSIYHRKNSEEMAYRLMMDALGTQGSGIRIGEGTDPLDTASQQLPPEQAQAVSQAGLRGMPQSAPIIQTSPFGTLLIPPNSSIRPIPKSKLKGKGSKTKAKDNQTVAEVNSSSLSRRKSSVIKPHWNQTPRILVVEDDMVYRQLSSKFLEKFGCIVETVENAHEAIAMMNNTKYDLVLMDIFFGPDMDGRKATSLIRQFDRYTPIISMTSSAQPKDVDSYLQSGMNDILAKPFTKLGLFGILDKHLLHMKVLQLSAEVPRSVGLPPLSDQGVQEAVAQGAAEASGLLNWGGTEMRNPLAAMGWSDDTYQIVLNQFLHTGMMPDVSSFNFSNGQPTITDSMSTSQLLGSGTGSAGYAESNGNILEVGDNSPDGMNDNFGEFHARKRNLEEEHGWNGGQQQQSLLASLEKGVQHEAKRAKR